MRLKPVLQLMSAAVVLGLTLVSTGGEARDQRHLSEQREPNATDHAAAGLDISARFNGRITAMLSVSDGSGDIYVAGDFSSYRGRPVRPMVRLRPDGSLHETFRLGGIPARRIAAIAPAGDASGDLYVADYAVEAARHAGWRFHSNVWRIHSDGTKDDRFSGAAFRHEDTYVPDARFVPVVTSVAPVGDGSGRVYAAGRFGVVRLNSDGSRDAGFSYGASAFHVVPAKDGSGTVYVTSNERIAPSGRHASQRLMRLKADGSRDQTFDGGTGVAPAWDIFTVAPVEDGTGDLFVGGTFANYGDPNPHGRNAVRLLARVNATGALDRTAPRPQIDERYGAVTALAKADDGSGDWLVTQNHAVLRYSAEGAKLPEAAQGAARRPDHAVASAATAPQTQPISAGPTQ